MEVDAVSNIITTVGFPIFCVLALGWFIYKAYLNLSQANKEREEKLYTTLGKTQEQLDNAQETNAKFVAVLEDFSKDMQLIKSDVAQVKNEIIKLPKRKFDKVEGETKDDETTVFNRRSTDNPKNSQ